MTKEFRKPEQLIVNCDWPPQERPNPPERQRSGLSANGAITTIVIAMLLMATIRACTEQKGENTVGMERHSHLENGQ